MTRPTKKKRAQGSIRQRGNSYLIEVYAGIDPVTGRRLYLNGSTTDEKESERIRTRLLAQVDEQRHARTNATLGYAVREWLRLADLEDSTRETYQMYVRIYIEPVLGAGPIKVPTKVLEEFYAELRRCRSRCDGKPAVEHRVDGPHECREVRHRRPPTGRRVPSARLRDRWLQGHRVQATPVPTARRLDHPQDSLHYQRHADGGRAVGVD